MGYAAPPPHKRFDNRFRLPNTHRLLTWHLDLQIVGSVTWYTAISEGVRGILKHQFEHFHISFFIPMMPLMHIPNCFARRIRHFNCRNDLIFKRKEIFPFCHF